MSKAQFLLSLDCEMLWGTRAYGGLQKYPYLKEGLSSCYDKLLESLENHKVRATFAFVGAMGLSREEFGALNLPPLKEAYLRRHKLCYEESEEYPELYFSPQTIEKVCASSIDHEIGSHSFSHIRFDHPYMDAHVAQFEWDTSYQVLSKFKEDVRSFVFPENRVGHVESFYKSPFSIYRSRDRYWYSSLSQQKLLHFLDQSITSSPYSVSREKDTHGNNCVSGSQMFLAYDGVRSCIPDFIRFKKVKNGIDKAIESSQVFHWWFHPWNLASSPRMFEVFAKVLEYVAKKRDEGLLDIVTMGDLSHER